MQVGSAHLRRGFCSVVWRAGVCGSGVRACGGGVLPWVVWAWVMGISGGRRELTEGFGSVFAAIVLLSVGIWMHGKAQADQWQQYVREKMAKALSGGFGCL